MRAASADGGSQLPPGPYGPSDETHLLHRFVDRPVPALVGRGDGQEPVPLGPMEILDGTFPVQEVVAEDVYLAFLEAGQVVFVEVGQDDAALGDYGLHGVAADPEGLKVARGAAADGRPVDDDGTGGGVVGNVDDGAARAGGELHVVGEGDGDETALPEFVAGEAEPVLGRWDLPPLH